MGMFGYRLFLFKLIIALVCEVTLGEPAPGTPQLLRLTPLGHGVPMYF